MNNVTSLPTTAAPVVTYKKVFKGYQLPKATQVLVDGVPTYEIQRVSKYFAGFVAVAINADGTCGDEAICGGDDVLLREVKEVLEGIIEANYELALMDTSTKLHKQAVEENFEALEDTGYAVQCVENDTVITAIDGDELPTLLNETYNTIRNAGMTTPAETLSLRELAEVIEAAYQAQQVLKDAVEALQSLRDRAALLGTNND